MAWWWILVDIVAAVVLIGALVWAFWLNRPQRPLEVEPAARGPSERRAAREQEESRQDAP